VGEAQRSSLGWFLPAGWTTKESATLSHPEQTANIIFSSEPIDDGMTVDVYADLQLDLLVKEFPEFELLEQSAATLNGVGDAVLRRFTWHPPDGEPVIQLQLYAVKGDRGYTATATARVVDYEAHSGTLEATLRSLSVIA
jgi:hypothetical protein